MELWVPGRYIALRKLKVNCNGHKMRQLDSKKGGPNLDFWPKNGTKSTLDLWSTEETIFCIALLQPKCNGQKMKFSWILLRFGREFQLLASKWQMISSKYLQLDYPWEGQFSAKSSLSKQYLAILPYTFTEQFSLYLTSVAHIFIKGGIDLVST